MHSNLKKWIALFLIVTLLQGALCFTTLAEEGGYGDSYGSVEDNLEDKILESKGYPVKKGMVYAYPGMSGAELVSTFSDKNNVKINGATATEAKVKTGNSISLQVEGVTLDEATIIVLGDVISDGECNVTDITHVTNYLLGNVGFTVKEYKSADINRSGKFTITDLIKMRRMILKSEDYAGRSPETGMYSTSQYVAAAYDAPMWEGNTVYQENAVVQQNAEGGIDDIQLLYKIDEIIEIRNYGLDKVYKEGEDYQLTADGKIRIPDGSSMTVAASDAFLGPAKGNWFDTPDGKYNIPSYGTNIHNYQISVTYKHSDAWKGTVPTDQSSKLSRFFAKLEKGEEVNMLFYGDSISTGLNASGCNESLKWKYDKSKGYSVYDESYKESINVAPYAASWPRAVYNRTQAKYPDAKINYINVASSSSNSTTHGTCNLQAAVIDNNPDIIFIAFGTNESTASKANYKNSQKTMLEGITKVHPDCAVVFVSPTVPNLLKYSNNNFADFQEAFYELQAEYPNLDIAVAPVYSVATYVNSIKKYQDISGNNINHPNDFGVRIYGNTIMQTLGLY